MSKISDKDKKDWEDFLSDNKKLPNKDFSDKTSSQTKKTEIDLHGYTLDEANIEIEKFILKSYEYGYKILRIVTGKGCIQIMKKSICLKRLEYIKIFCARIYKK